MTDYTAPSVPLPPKMLEDYSDSELEQIRNSLAVAAARSDPSVRGFKEFYRLIFGMDLPFHVEEWVQVLEEEMEKPSVRLIVEAFRGSTKTTSFTVAYTAFYIGHHPEETNIIIQASDESASANAKAIANIIARNPVWAMIFPNIVPDTKKGWAESGYYVKNTMDDNWEVKMSSVMNPTIIGFGYKSSVIIGKHPSGLLIIDDIHDENNTSSELEMQRVIKTMTSVIFPMMLPSTKQIFIGTPWKKSDAMAFLKESGKYRCIWTPAFIYKRNEVGEIIRDDAGEPVLIYTWPEFRGKAFLEDMKVVGSIEFQRMYALDLRGMDGYVLKESWLIEYPSEKINKSWQKIIGIDYADVWDPKKANKRDYLTIAFGLLIPGGGIILYGGLRLQLSTAESILKIEEVCEIIKPTRVGMEAIGKAEPVAKTLVMNSTLPYHLIKHKPPKEVCYTKELGPAFELGFMYISDERNPFLKQFREEWLSYGVETTTDDCLDAAWVLMRAGKDYVSLARDNFSRRKAESEDKPIERNMGFFDSAPEQTTRTMFGGKQ